MTNAAQARQITEFDIVTMVDAQRIEAATSVATTRYQHGNESKQNQPKVKNTHLMFSRKVMENKPKLAPAGPTGMN